MEITLVKFLHNTVQGGSDKSGILPIYLKNYTAQLKIIRFNQNKNTVAEEQIENRIIQ